MRYAMFDENGHLQQYVGVEPGSEVELPDGWTLRDAEGAIVEFGHPLKPMIEAAREKANQVINALDAIEAALDE